MSGAATVLAIIDEFVTLAKNQRQRGLPTNQRARIEVLDERLRGLIDGARPAPKRISNPEPVAASVATPAHGVAPAKIQVKASQALDDALAMTSKDKKKLSSIRVEDLPKSSYTPPATPAFMQDYYSESLVPARMTAQDTPIQAVSPTGEMMTADLDREVRVLLGLEKPAAPTPVVATVDPAGRPAGRASTPAPAPTPAAPLVGVQAIVHLMAGGTKRGRIDGFDARTKHLELLAKDPTKPSTKIPMADVLAIFFAAKAGAAPTEATGTALTVKLTNDRQVAGMSADYTEGGGSLTIVPNPRRGSVDRIWVPAQAVKAIELL